MTAVPSVNEKDVGTTPHADILVGGQFILGARSCGRVNEPVILHVVGHDKLP